MYFEHCVFVKCLHKLHNWGNTEISSILLVTPSCGRSIQPPRPPSRPLTAREASLGDDVRASRIGHAWFFRRIVQKDRETRSRTLFSFTNKLSCCDTVNFKESTAANKSRTLFSVYVIISWNGAKSLTSDTSSFDLPIHVCVFLLLYRTDNFLQLGT